MDQTYQAVKYRVETSFNYVRLFRCLGLLVLSSMMMLLKDNYLLFLSVLSVAFYFGIKEGLVSVGSILITTYFFNSDLLYPILLTITCYIGILLIFKLFKATLRSRVIITTFISDFLMRFYFINNYSISFNYNLIFITFGITVYVGCITYFLSKIKNNHKFYSPYLVLLITMLLTTCFLGISSFDLSLNVSFILIGLLSLIIASSCGISVTALTSVATLCLVMLINPLDSMYYLMLLIAPIVVSFFEITNKFFMLISYLLVGVLTLYFNNLLMPLSELHFEILITGLIFILIPTKLLKMFKKKVLSNEEIFIIQEKHYEQLQNKIVNKLANLTVLNTSITNQIFNNKVEPFNQYTIETIKKDVCTYCPRHSMCLSYKNDNKVFDIGEKILKENISIMEKKYIEEHCLKPSIFIKRCMEQRVQMQIENKYNRMFLDLKGVLKDNLQGITGVVNEIKEDIKSSGLIINGIEKEISIKLDQMGINLLYVYYYDEKLDLARIEMGLMSINLDVVKASIIEVVNSITKKNFVIDKIEKINSEEYLKIFLIEERHYTFNYGVGTLSKEKICGDSHLILNKNNKSYFIISDGMGSGEKASLDSKSTIEIFTKMIEAGVKNSVAVKTMNAMLKIKNVRESYSTLDVLSIDSYTGIACFTKTGCPSTYLFRDNKITNITSTSLPIGIVDDIEAFDYVMQVKKDDVFIMASDGVDFSRFDLLKILLKYDNPQMMVKDILKCFNDQLDDDLTIMIIKVF